MTEADGMTVDVIRDAATSASSKDAAVFAKLNVGAKVNSLSFSSNGRMIVAQHGNKLATYDIETAKAYIKTLGFGSDQTAQFKWLDDYYLWSDDDGTLRLFEFDGTNEHDITSVATGYDVMLSINGKQLLSIGKDGVAHDLQLQASKLIIGN
jgi:WD40 repeat protein